MERLESLGWEVVKVKPSEVLKFLEKPEDYVYVFVSQQIAECGTPDLEVAVFSDLEAAKNFKKDTKEWVGYFDDRGEGSLFCLNSPSHEQWLIYRRKVS